MATETSNATIPDMIPARMLNEFVYCPRLFYLEWVQGEFADNLDTVDGRFKHSRVDATRGALPEPQDLTGEERLHATSIDLGSETLGLTAKLDLIEQEDGEVSPVDYKRGKPPGRGKAWETDQTQVCAQGLLLQDAGYTCTKGVIYYATTKERVDVPFTPELIAQTLEALAAAQRLASIGPIPPPLVDSPKCVRCSLASICLPDELNALAGRRANELENVRRLMPSRDEAMALYVQDQGASVGKSGDVLEVRQRYETIQTVRVGECSQVSLFGNVQISAQALYALSSRGIPVCHFSTGGWFHSITAGMPGKNVDLRRQQYAIGSDPAAALTLARQIVGGKVRNSRTLLRRNHDDLSKPVLDELERLAEAAETASTMATLLGLEGAAARLYFRNFSGILKQQEEVSEFQFDGRNRRPPRDPVNAMLSFVYALLTKDVTVTVLATGMDPYMGVYHQPHFGRPALALDLSEEFRPLIADSVVQTMVNVGEIEPSDFLRRAGACVLNPDGRKKVIGAYERRMAAEVTHPTFGYRISYRRVLEVQARLFARVLTNELSAYVPFRTR